MIHIRTTSRRARFHSISWRPDPPGGPNKAGEVLVGDSFDVITVENRQNMIEIEILGTAPSGARNILPAALPRFHPEVIHPGQIDVLGNPGKRPARRRPVRIDAEETRGDPRVGAAPGCGYDAHVTRFIGNTVGHVLDDVELGHSKSPPSLKRRSGPLETERLVRSSRRVLRVSRPARVVLMDGDEIRNRHPRHVPRSRASHGRASRTRRESEAIDVEPQHRGSLISWRVMRRLYPGITAEGPLRPPPSSFSARFCGSSSSGKTLDGGLPERTSFRSTRSRRQKESHVIAAPGRIVT